MLLDFRRVFFPARDQVVANACGLRLLEFVLRYRGVIEVFTQGVSLGREILKPLQGGACVGFHAGAKVIITFVLVRALAGLGVFVQGLGAFLKGKGQFG